VIVSAMTVLLGIAAFAIDTANWMVRHHDAQVVADSAALAAAQCLANPHQPANIKVNGAQQTLTCSSSTDTPDAQYVAVAYAAANGVTIQPSDVTFSGKVVTVSASTTTPSIFARVMGIGTTSQSARAGAGWTAGSACTTAGQNCDFMFANSSSCSSSSAALNVSTQGKATIEGNIQTNGYLSADGTGNAGGIDGTGNFGSNCPNGSAVTGNHDPWKTGDPTQASAPMTWPIDYTKDFPACGTAGDPCQLNGYPSFCKNEGTNIIVGTTAGLPPSDKPSPGLIYCASGTSTNLGDPSTWNGSVTISMSGSNTINDSFVGGTISYSGDGGDTISACGWTASGYSSSSCSSPAPATPNYPLFYAVGKDPNSAACAAGTNPATSCAFSMQSGGNLTLDGDMFVENGTGSFNFTGDQTAANTFIEANTIVASLDGDVKGDGPPVDNGNGTGGPGTISLVQ
ncbi:MAG TPA: pilus assembly protein TadG-related protein, partial [Solirubrobacteraceae bacterium]|nr:pilus assembly protein TadG-related protein [Solirubrobacteraceae bacterium]